ncbi:MAG: hypothetical protein JU82_00415 [Sulfuricurvum sp. MLSB]|uniref:hypothetical protein n=1 Tax=unclassified Sulfuricurvum TaxID=2632390 RepID=UPI000505B196|nr:MULTISPECIES: hypothetical protein [unclassified Sulfuricurvum]KFN40877.1 MAG: hypothetical protein JU82_00415 [Sulfuricurvum sp. MLSB]
MRVLDWLQLHHFFEIFLVFALMSGAMILVILMIKVGWNTIFETGFMKRGASELPERIQERIESIVEELLRVREFDTAMILMEKQRLKKLELQELGLKVHLLEACAKGEHPCSPTSSI